MKEKLLADWKHKYERIQWELKDNEKKLENVKKREEKLFTDIFVPIIIAFVSFLVISFSWQFRENISEWFYPFYIAAIYGLSIAAVIYNGYQLVKRIRLYLYHTIPLGEMKYPKPERRNANYPLHIPPNYNAEHRCIEWLLHQYTEDVMKLTALKRKIEEAPEDDLGSLQEELDGIVFYERVGCARE